MNINRNGEQGLPCGNINRLEFMKTYDTLPPKIRKFFQEIPLNLCTSKERSIKDVGEDAFLATLQREMAEAMKKATISTYGPEHPQA